MLYKSVTAFLVLIVIVLSGCGKDDKEPADVQGSNPQRQPTTESSSTITPAPSPTTVATLPTSIINPSNAANIVQRFETGKPTLYGYTWSPDSQVLVATTSRGVRFYDLYALDSPPRIFEQYQDYAVISPDGKSAISRSLDGASVVWDVASGELRFALDGEGVLFSTPLFSPEGEQIAAIQENAIRLWDASDGSVVETIALGVEQYNGLFYRDDGTLIALAYNGMITGLWDVMANEVILSMGEFVLAPFAEAIISNNGHIVAVPTPTDSGENVNFVSYQNIQVWNTLTGDNVRRLRGGGIPSFTPDGTGYFLYDYGQGFVVRDLETDLDINSFSVPPASGGFAGASTNIAMSPDGTFIGGMDYGGTLYLFEIERGALYEISDFGSYVTSLHLHPDGKTLLIGTSTGAITIWDVTTGEILREGILENASQAFFLPDGEHLLGIGLNVTEWDAESLERSDFIMEVNTSSGVLSPDGSLLALVLYEFSQSQPGASTRNLMVWNLEADQLQFDNIALPDSQYVDRLQFSPDGQYLLVTSQNIHHIYDAQSGEPLNSLTLDDTDFTAATFHPDNEQLVITTLAYEVTDTEAVPHSVLWLWGVHADGLEQLAEIDSAAIFQLTYSPDGSLLALRGQFEDGAVWLWDTTTQEILARVGNRGGPGSQMLGFTPDGGAIILVGQDNFVQVWGLPD